MTIYAAGDVKAAVSCVNSMFGGLERKISQFNGSLKEINEVARILHSSEENIPRLHCLKQELSILRDYEIKAETEIESKISNIEEIAREAGVSISEEGASLIAKFKQLSGELQKAHSEYSEEITRKIEAPARREAEQRQKFYVSCVNELENRLKTKLLSTANDLEGLNNILKRKANEGNLHTGEVLVSVLDSYEILKKEQRQLRELLSEYEELFKNKTPTQEQIELIQKTRLTIELIGLILDERVFFNRVLPYQLYTVLFNFPEANFPEICLDMIRNLKSFKEKHSKSLTEEEKAKIDSCILAFEKARKLQLIDQDNIEDIIKSIQGNLDQLEVNESYIIPFATVDHVMFYQITRLSNDQYQITLVNAAVSGETLEKVWERSPDFIPGTPPPSPKEKMMQAADKSLIIPREALSDEFFKKYCVREDMNRTSTWDIVEGIDECFTAYNPILARGRVHKFQVKDNCPEKAFSSCLHGLLGDSLHARFKAHRTELLGQKMTEKETRILRDPEMQKFYTEIPFAASLEEIASRRERNTAALLRDFQGPRAQKEWDKATAAMIV